MSKAGLFLLWFGLFIAICVSLITTGATFNYNGPGNFFDTPDRVIAAVFYHQLAINFVAFAILAALWDGVRHLWTRHFNDNRAAAHGFQHAHAGFYILMAGLVIGAAVGFYNIGRQNHGNLFVLLGTFFKWIGLISLPISILAMVYESQQRFRPR